MTSAPARNVEPIPGYRLTERLGTGGFGEVWKCQAPGGLLKAIKFVHGNLHHANPDSRVEQEWQALNRVKAIRHPFLLSMDRLEIIDGQLLIVMELADKSLRDLFREYQAAGLPGIPREELLGYLREAAEVLDLMNLHHQLQHLDIKPDNLFLVGNHIKVADFGLVTTSHGLHPPNSPSNTETGITPLYAPPERFQGRVSQASDQYSMAVVYQELLTGTFPFDGKSGRQLLMQHLCEQPQLRALPEVDRPAVARALSKDPQQRFPSCTDFVRALASEALSPDPAAVPGGSASMKFAPEAQTVSAGQRNPTERSEPPSPEVLYDTSQGGSTRTEVLSTNVAPFSGHLLSTEPSVPVLSLPQIMADFVAAVVHPSQLCEKGDFRYLWHPGDVLEHRFLANVLRAVATAKLEEVFRQQWNAIPVLAEDPGTLVFHVAPCDFWQRCLGRAPSVLVRILLQQTSSRPPLTRITVRISPFRASATPEVEFSRPIGPTLIASVRSCLPVVPERRAQERLAYEHPLQVRPVLPNFLLGAGIQAVCRDVSLTGMRLWLPEKPSTGQVCVELPPITPAGSVAILASIQRVQACAGAGYEVGVRFLKLTAIPEAGARLAAPSPGS